MNEIYLQWRTYRKGLQKLSEFILKVVERTLPSKAKNCREVCC